MIVLLAIWIVLPNVNPLGHRDESYVLQIDHFATKEEIFTFLSLHWFHLYLIIRFV